MFGPKTDQEEGIVVNGRPEWIRTIDLFRAKPNAVRNDNNLDGIEHTFYKCFTCIAGIDHR